MEAGSGSGSVRLHPVGQAWVCGWWVCILLLADSLYIVACCLKLPSSASCVVGQYGLLAHTVGLAVWGEPLPTVSGCVAV